jgi:hypothetical protein
MRNLYLITCALILISSVAFSQNLTWAKQLGGTNIDYGRTIAVDASGNVITAGYFYATADFDPSASTANLVSAGLFDVYISKLDASGNYVWAKRIGAAQNDLAYDVVVDASGNVYVTGVFRGTVDFDPGPSVVNLTGSANGNAFILKLNSAGAYQWAVMLGGASGSSGFGIALDAAGTNVYSTGNFSGTGDFDPSASTANLVSFGGTIDIYVSKLSAAAGAYVFAKQMGGSTMDENGRDIVLDASGNIYTTGDFDGTCDFDPSAATANLNSFGSQDIYVSKLDNSGTFVWAKQMGGAAVDLGLGIALDASNNVYTTGYFDATADFDPSASTFTITTNFATNAFVSKLSTAGAFVWAKNFDTNAGSFGYGISLDGSGNIFTTGYFYGACDFDPSASTSNLTSAGNEDVYISKLDASGNFVSVRQLGGVNTDYGYGITVDASNNIYTTGSFQGLCDFDPSASTFNITSYGGTNEDAFVHKMAACSGAPATPGAISGSISVCVGSTQIYTIAPVATATSYTWTLPGGWTGSSTTNTISVTVGASSGSVSVIAGNSCGTSAASNLSVTVTSSPATPGAISGSISVCSGSSKTYSVAAVAGATAYTWSLPAGWTGASTTTIINVTVGATSGNVSVTANNACGSSAIQTLSVTVGTSPTTPGAISGPIFKCAASGASTYSIAAVANATAYTWSLPAGWSGASTTNIISATPGSSGIFTVVATNSCGTSAQQTLSVTITNVPAMPGVISGSIALCAGSGASTYSVAAVATATGYVWSLPAAWTGTNNTNIISATPGTSGIFTVVATNSCGSSAQRTLSVTVNAQPTISVNSGSICSGKTFTIVPSGASTYTIQGGSATVSPGSSTSYTVIGTSTAGCVSASFATSNVTVNATPTISMASGTICPGGSFTLTGSGANTYTYSSGPAVSPTITSTYSVLGTSTAGCISNTATAVVTVTNNINVTITGTNVICSGQSLLLTAGGASTYTWNTSANGTTIAPTPTANTTYSVIGTSGTCSNSALFSVTVNPTPTITASTNNSLICWGQLAQLTASGATSYTWNPGAAAGSSISVSPTVTTIYTVTGTNANGCSGTATVTQDAVDCTGLSVITSLNSNIAIYPNPTSGLVTLSGVEGHSIYVYNILGVLVYAELNTTTSNCQLDLSQQPKGIYFVKVGAITRKIIKE